LSYRRNMRVLNSMRKTLENTLIFRQFTTLSIASLSHK
jgi:hypothetical protein